jgi:hypothetical protein
MNIIRPVNWKLALLKQNPFPDTPPRRPEDAVWAGLPRLKEQFDVLFGEALTTSTTQVVLNWGAFGSGKTHAAVYFGIPERLPSVEGKQIRSPWILYVRTPKTPSQASEILYRDIIETIRFNRLREVIREFIAEKGEEETLRILQEIAESEALGRAIWLLGVESKGTEQPRLIGETNEFDEEQRLLEAYFFSENTKTDLKRLGLSRSIDSPQDRFRVLGSLLQCLIGFAPTGTVGRHSRVILWIDELEDLIYFTSRQYRPFTQGLRDLIDRLPAYFTLLMNFTLAAPEALEDATVVLGDALMSRITHQIYFEEPSEDDAYEYVCDLLRQFRTEDPALQVSETYPFEEDALRYLIERLPSRTPRDINKRCSEVISKALQRGEITDPGEGSISRKFISDLEQERIELDIG